MGVYHHITLSFKTKRSLKIAAQPARKPQRPPHHNLIIWWCDFEGLLEKIQQFFAAKNWTQKLPGGRLNENAIDYSHNGKANDQLMKNT